MGSMLITALLLLPLQQIIIIVSIHYEAKESREIKRTIIKRTSHMETGCIFNCERNIFCKECGMLKYEGISECLLLGEINVTKVLPPYQILILFEAIRPGKDAKPLDEVPEVSGDGSSASKAGLSCADIKKNNPLAKDGYLWLDLNGPVNAYCDMTVDQGGWLMVGHVVVTSDNDQHIGIDKHTLSKHIKKLHDVSKNNYLLDGFGLKELHDVISFKQIRIYCSKRDKQFHLATKLNQQGTDVVDYVIMKHDTCPMSTDAFQIMPGDRSTLARQTDHLGFYSDGHFGYCALSKPPLIPRANRLYNRLLAIKQTANLVLLSSAMECDDLVGNYGYSKVGEWKFFVR